MSGAIMSPSLLVAQDAAAARRSVRDQKAITATGWNPGDFAREQIYSLVTQVFLSREGQPVRHVVFTAAEPDCDLHNLCWRVAQALAVETQDSVAIAADHPQDDPTTPEEPCVESEWSESGWRTKKMQGNLWQVWPVESERVSLRSADLQAQVCAIRKRFDYSIIAGPRACESNAATAMARLADGVVLVLTANRTRRITARKLKEKLVSVNASILGVVLSDRTFPIPERIYRRL